MEERQIKLNEQVLTEDEFAKKKKEVEKMAGAKLIEVAQDEYKIQLRD